MFQTVLFDFDGTVFDTVDGITKSIQFALSKHGRDAELEELRCFAGPPLVDKFMEVYGVTQEEAEQLVVDFRERYRPIGIFESAPFSGIRELTEKLHAAGKKVGIATSKPQSMAEQLLERHGLSGCFDAACGSEPGLNNNAKWEVVLRAMQACGAESRRRARTNRRPHRRNHGRAVPHADGRIIVRAGESIGSARLQVSAIARKSTFHLAPKHCTAHILFL